jgi:Kef-type K+ transport system membrane component KefB
VSITVETLRELGKLRTRAGSAILGAAIIDDVLGIVALTVVTSFSDPSVKIAWVLLKIVLFFVFALVVGLGFAKFYRWWTCKTTENRPQHAIVAFVFCLLFSYIAEAVFGVADITGAFVAGLMLSNTNSEKRSIYLADKFETVSFLYLSPVFFASIGLQVELSGMNAHILLFAVALTVIAVLTKIVGCGLGAKLCHYTNRESLQIGTGMISRGEVALIVATKGASLGLISTELFGPVIVVVVVTTIITPILLKVVFRDKDPAAPVSATPVEG